MENILVSSSSYHSLLTADECDSIIEYGNSLQAMDGTISNAEATENVVNVNIRKSSVVFFKNDDNKIDWLRQKIGDAIIHVNNESWQFDLEFVEVLQFTKYEKEGDYYGPHLDIGAKGVAQRKLSFSLQLSDSSDYEGGDLLIMHGAHNDTASRDRGDIIFFPSFMMHQVTPIKRGKRYSLVGWVCGRKFR